jgi:photosystem II stability/assembly factor-like uncharacterized protein
MFGRRRRRNRFTIVLLGTIAVASVGVLAALAGFPDAADDTASTADARPVHIHALDLNPRDEALFVASHTGLYRISRGAQTAARVSDLRPDLKAFTVVRPDRFLGSGHSDRAGEARQLGLIESRNGGEDWRPIGLRGRADFHVLRVGAAQIVGYDSSARRLMISRDGGESWQAHRLPAALVDVAVHPARAKTLVATTQTKLLLSSDGGRTWQTVSDKTGLLAWPRGERLFVLASDGRLWRSRDLGRRWQARGGIGGEPAAMVARTDQRLFAALKGGVIKTSADGGSSWRLLALSARDGFASAVAARRSPTA